MKHTLSPIDAKELELPETLHIRDIETRVLQSIVVQCLLKIEGISLIEGSLIDAFFGHAHRITGILVDQEQQNHSVSVKVEIDVAYGVRIPEKAEEIQMTITQELSRLTGLHVSMVHVVFKNLIPLEKLTGKKETSPNPSI